MGVYQTKTQSKISQTPMTKKTMYLTGLLTMSTVLVASAQSTLYTTTQDFAQFGAATSGSFYSESSTLNGIGNSTAAGGAGVAGSLQLTTGDAGWGATSFNWLPNLTDAAYQAWSPGYSNPNRLATSGIISMDVYTGGLTGWSDYDFIMQGGGMGWTEFHKNDALTQTFTGADGNTWNRYFYEYTLPASSSANWEQIAIQSWGDIANVGQSFYVDNIQVLATPAPEPGTMALAALGGAALLFFRRRNVR